MNRIPCFSGPLREVSHRKAFLTAETRSTQRFAEKTFWGSSLRGLCALCIAICKSFVAFTDFRLPWTAVLPWRAARRSKPCHPERQRGICFSVPFPPLSSPALRFRAATKGSGAFCRYHRRPVISAFSANAL